MPFVAPFNGVITRWGFRAGCCNDPHTDAVTMTLKTFRPGAQDGQFGYSYIVPVNEGPSFEVPAGNQLPSDPHTELPARMRIAAGERVGIVAPHQFGFAVYDPTPNVTMTVVSNGFSYANPFNGTALAISATIEPDADGDGFGDETQDCDPANPVQAAGCSPPTPPPPPPPPSPLPVGQSGGGCQGPCGGGAVVFAGPIPPPPASGDGSRIYVPVACPAASTKPCGGYLIAQVGTAGGATASKRLRIGRTRYSVAPGTTKRVQLKLTRAARKLFRAKRRRTVTFTLKPDDGPAVTVKKTITFPKPKSKRERRGS